MVATNATLEVEGLSELLYINTLSDWNDFKNYTLEGDESYSELEQKYKKHS